MKVSRWSMLCLFLMAIAIVLIRWLTYQEAFERDLTIYAVISHEMLGGRPLYSDLWDIKPPGVYLIYAAAELIAGYGRNQIFLLGTGAALVTLLGIYRAVIEIAEDEAAALWASVFWVLLGSDIDLLANQPNAEVFMNAAFIWGLAFFWRALKRPLQEPNLEGKTNPNWLLAAGCLWAVGTLVKQVLFMTPLLLGLYLLFGQRASPWKTRLLGVAALWVPTVALWAATFAYFGATHRWEIFNFSLIKFGSLYVADSARIKNSASIWALLAPRQLFVLFPVIALIWLSLVWNRNSLSKTWAVLGLLVVATQIAISLPGFYHIHYYQLWLPLVCWAGGFGVAQLRLQPSGGKPALWLAAGTALMLIGLQWPKWRLSPDQVSIRKYDSPIFVKQFEMAPRIAALMKPGQTLYQYGFDPEFYFVTKQHPPIGVLSLGAPDIQLPDWFQDEIIAKLNQTKPELVWIDLTFSHSRITDVISRNYVALPDSDKKDQFLLMARKGGDLARRLNHSAQKWP